MEKLDLPEERCRQRTLKQCGIGAEEPLRPRPREQVTEVEVTRRAVARMTVEERQAWMQKGGEDLPVTTVLGRQGEPRATQLLEVRTAQLLAAEGMGLGHQDVDVDCCSEGSGELLDTHELRELSETVGSKQQQHERRVGTTVGSRVQAGGDNANEGQPADVAAVHCGTGASNGGDAHVGVRSDAQGHTGQDTTQDSGEVRSAPEDSGCVLGL